MSKLVDTAEVNSAHACGYTCEHDINSSDRLRVYSEFGGLTIIRGETTLELDGDEAEFLLDVISRQAGAERKAIWEMVG